MRRKRLHLSLTLAVLGLGMALGWTLGTPATKPLTGEAVVVGEQDAANHDGQVALQREGRQEHAFRMPYFSFRVLTRPVSSAQGM